MQEIGRITPANRVFRTDRRDEGRTEVFLRTIVSHGTYARREPVAAELVNIAHSGFLIRTKAHFRKGDHFRIALPAAGHVHAKVIWSLKGCAGCHFQDMLEDQEFESLLHAIRHAKPGWLEKLPR